MDLLKTEEAAKRLNVSQETLYAWRRTGKGPRYLKIEGSIRYPLDDLIAWIENSPSNQEKIAVK